MLTKNHQQNLFHFDSGKYVARSHMSTNIKIYADTDK